GPGRRHPAAMLEPREADERYQVDRPVRRIEALACGRTTGGVQSFATFMRRPLRIGATFAIISFNPSPTGCLGQVYPVAARRRPPRWRRWTIRYSITFARRTSDSHCCRQGERSTDRGGMGNWLAWMSAAAPPRVPVAAELPPPRWRLDLCLLSLDGRERRASGRSAPLWRRWKS